MHFTQGDDWLVSAIDDVQESKEGELASAPTPASALDIDVYRSQDLIILKGQFQGELHLMCSRCANNYNYPLQTQFQCLFTKDKSFLENDGFGGKGKEASRGHAIEDIDIEFLDKEYIELGDVVKEQLYLKIPFQPLCDEACKGLCSTCGQNQNTQPCQCFRLRTGPLAKGLRDLKI